MPFIQIVSDLHIEFHDQKQKFNFLTPSAPILALLGDICCCGDDLDFSLFKRFILEILPKYQHIIFVPGNHEYYYNPVKRGTKPTYQNTIQGIDEKIKAFFSSTSKKLHLLTNNSLKFTFGKTTYIIAGSTLWTWIPPDKRKMIQLEMNDYQYVHYAVNKKPTPLTSDFVADTHLKSVKFIKSQIQRAKKINARLIILTHHKPYLSDDFDPNTINLAYESNLKSLFTTPITLWGYGHTHMADNTFFGKTLLYSNPKGYPRQKTKFNRSQVVKI